MGAANRLGAGLREAEVLDLAFLDQVLHRAGHVLDRHVGVDPVLVEQVNRVDPEALQRCVSDCADVLRAAVRATAAISRLRIDVEAELRGDHHLASDGGERLADQLLVHKRPIRLGRIEEGHAAVNGCAEQRDARLLLNRTTIGVAQPHAAEAER